VNDTAGVYFRYEDYASFRRRVLIDVVDLLIVAIFGVVVLVPLAAFPVRAVLNLAFATFVAVSFCYFVLLKRSTIRTIGYRIGGVRIVGEDGQTASVLALTFRLALFPLGPLNWFVDLLWLSGDVHRQALRDKLAHTYVVKTKAQPIGAGKIVYRSYDIFGCNFTFREIAAGTVAASDLVP
jgi:uncharacterized RDD family membrane protein YckC